jgi:DNA polymerase III epsilon subunit-like protein
VSLCHSSHWCRWHWCVGCVDDAGVDDVDYIVGHNIDFDLNVLKSELYRNSEFELIKQLEQKKILCTMKMMAVSLNKDRPSLAECYSKLYGKIMTGSHNSKYDIIYTSKILSKCLI